MPKMNAPYSINSKARPQVMRIGNEGEPLVVIDDIFLAPEAIIEYAAEKVQFGPGGAGYPGLRAPVPQSLNDMIFYELAPILKHVFQISDDDNLTMMSSFSMITQRPTPNWIAQLLPHFDNVDPNAVAIIVYLCNSEWDGTAFYRHRSTGFETISPSRSESYNRRLADELTNTTLPDQFPNEHHPLFDQFYVVPPKFNRLAIYRSRLLHSGLMAPSAQLCDDPRHGRLTITAFLRPA